MSSDTPYNSLLLFHGTGTGKTCSSISIAEQYSEEIMRQNKKNIVVLNFIFKITLKRIFLTNNR